jgi:hypothetical protein
MIDLYKITYNITKGGVSAYLFTWVYVSILNLISIYGIGLLLEGWISSTRIVHKLFAFPYIILTSAAVLYYNYSGMKKLELSKVKKVEPFYPPIIIYTAISIVLCVYIYYRDKIF